jgi:hypothetical protein
MSETIQSPDGELMRLIIKHSTTRATDACYKPVIVDTQEIEVLISDSRLISKGSQFGHVAIDIDEQVYGRAPDAWDQDSRKHYLYRQQVKMNRDTVGYVLRASAADKKRLIAEILSRKSRNKAYDLAMNSCSSNASEVLGTIGIIAYDPRWTVVATPADMATALKRSKRLVRINFYPKSK